LSADAVAQIVALDRQSTPSQREKTTAIISAFDAVQPRYRELLGAPEAVSPGEMEAAWQLAGFMAYATVDSGFTNDMLRLHDEYTRRRLEPTMAQRERLLASLIALRRFDAARAYAKKAGLEMEYVPHVEGVPPASATQLNILAIDTTREILVHKRLPPDDRLQVYVLSFIGCTFSRHAADAIEHHELLRNFMRAHSTWITLPGPLYFNDVLAWNRTHPSTPLTYIENMAPWGFVDDWSTPTFYFMKGGQLVAKLQGWPDDQTGIKALLKAVVDNESPVKPAEHGLEAAAP